MKITVEIPCTRCEGNGQIECCECGHCKDCPDCDGKGVLQDLCDLVIPEKHKHRDELEALLVDHDKCHADHEKLCHMNPRAKDSYDRQLAATIANLTEQVQALLA